MKRLSFILPVAFLFCGQFNTPIAPVYTSHERNREFGRSEARWDFDLDYVWVNMKFFDISGHEEPLVTLYLQTQVSWSNPATRISLNNATHVYNVSLSKDDEEFRQVAKLGEVSNGIVDTLVDLKTGYRQSDLSDLSVWIPVSAKALGYPDYIVWQAQIHTSRGSHTFPEKPQMYEIDKDFAYRPEISIRTTRQYIRSWYESMDPGDSFHLKVDVDLQNSDDSPAVKVVKWKTNNGGRWKKAVSDTGFVYKGVIPQNWNDTRIIVQAENEFGYYSIPDTSGVVWDYLRW